MGILEKMVGFTKLANITLLIVPVHTTALSQLAGVEAGAHVASFTKCLKPHAIVDALLVVSALKLAENELSVS